CNAVRAQSWSGELPCAVDISGLATQSYALQVTATDGTVIWPSSDTQSFAYAGEANVFLSSAGCCDVPRSGCKSAGQAVMIVRNENDDRRDTLLWKWLKGPPTTTAEFGNPQNAADYVLCMYGGPLQSLLTNGQLRVPRSSSKWVPRGSKGWRYDDDTASADGAWKLQLIGSTRAKPTPTPNARGPPSPHLLLPLSLH